MYLFRINGGAPLKGEVVNSGSKNAALPLMFAALLAEGATKLTRVPVGLQDIKTTAKLLRVLGVKVDLTDQGEALIDATCLKNDLAPYDLVKTMRASVLVLGPLLARLGEARVSLPGGCAIGPRPVNFHLKAMESLGAEVRIEAGYIHAEAKKLVGARIAFDVVSVGATENALMAASMAEGKTLIENAACEPEIVDLANMLNKMGAHVEGAGTPEIIIEGVEKLNPVEYQVIPDRVEAVTFLAAAAATGGDITVLNSRPDHYKAALEKFRDAGAQVEAVEANGEGRVRLKVESPIKAVNIRTAPYPGFPTDMQAPLMAMMTRAEGRSVITETIFENRFMHAPELMRMGARIGIEGRTAIVDGSANLTAAEVTASDLRGGAALVIAALAAEGQSEIRRVYHIDRGYENFEEKLKSLGANIERSWEEKS